MNTTGDEAHWDEFLDAALFATQIRHREGSKWSPFELLYGRKPQLAHDNPILRSPDAPAPAEGEHQQRLDNLDAKRQEAAARETTRAERDKRIFDTRMAGNELDAEEGEDARWQKRKRKKAIFKAGNMVLVRNNQAKKAEPNWTGPWIVHDVRDKGTIQLCDLRGRIRPDLVHVNQTRPAVARDPSSKKAWHLPKSLRKAWAKEDATKSASAETAVERRLPSIKIIGRFAQPDRQPLPGEKIR